jgi:hypothetical protein
MLRRITGILFKERSAKVKVNLGKGYEHKHHSDHEPGDEVDSYRIGELFGVSIRSDDSGTWDEDSSIRHPEGAIRGKSCEIS